MRVNLRRAQALMAKQFLYAAQVRSVVQKMRGKTVAERVRADPRIQAGREQIFIQLAAHRTGG